MLSKILLESLQLRGDLDDPDMKVRKSTQHNILNKYCQMVQHGYFELRTGFRCLL